MKKLIKQLLIFSIILFASNINIISSQIIKKTHLNSDWYPQEKNQLSKELDFYLNKAKKDFKVVANPNNIKILIAPHASLYYSGLCAATAYQTLLSNNKKNEKIKNIIILSPSHTKFFNGIALPNFDEYQTPLGNLSINKVKLNKLKEKNLFKIDKNIFNKEHSIEIQFPFLQKTIQDFKIIPLIIGQINETNINLITKSIEKIIDKNTLIVISSDFIHYGKDYNYTPFERDVLDFIRFVDSAALEAIGKQSYKMFNKTLKNSGATICGQNCIKIALKLLENKIFGNVESRLTCYYTSAQLTQARKNNNINIKKLLSDHPDSKVKNSVSYAGLIFTTEKQNSLKKEDQLTNFEKKSLLELSYRTIENEFNQNKLPNHMLWPIKSFGLQNKNGAFVTLHKNGNLKGCIGRITTNEELFKTVQEMTKAAAFQDARFRPLQKDELDKIKIEISVLTKPNKINDYRKIKLGKDGIILKKETKEGRYISSVFLPEVATDQGWTIEKTLEQLSLKAGLNKNAWQEDCSFEIFESFKIEHNTKAKNFKKTQNHVEAKPKKDKTSNAERRRIKPEAKMKQYKNIIFDLGAVLVNWQPEKIISSIFKDNSKFAVENFYENKSKIWSDFNKGIITPNDLANFLGKEYSELLLKKLPNYLFILEEGIEIFNLIKEKGYKTYILSNFPKELFESAKNINNYEDNFLSKFDGKIISYKVNSIKPEPEIYQALLDKYNLIPEECFFIDDKEENILGGKNLGINGVVCKNHEQLKNDLIKLKII
jgi:MEMO1 family protein